VYKGADPGIDSYSAFFDNGRRQATEMHGLLKSRSVERVYLCGLATDYCVKASALDARWLGYETRVIIDACRGIEAHEGDINRALDAMRRAGVEIVQSEQVLRHQSASEQRTG
jgi:nicotinamidase/pyrazinamidase